MSAQRRTKQAESLETRLAMEAARLREEAMKLQPSAEREQLLRRARQCDTGADMSEWLHSPGLQPPA